MCKCTLNRHDVRSKMKNIHDFKHVKSVTAIALLKNGKPAGKIIANWSDNPAGSVCTACVMLSPIVINGNKVFVDSLNIVYFAEITNQLKISG